MLLLTKFASNKEKLLLPGPVEELQKKRADFQEKVVEKENSLRRVGDSAMDLLFIQD